MTGALWYPGATKRPVTGHDDGPVSGWLGAVLHVNQSNGNLYNWVSGPHDMSCHFEVYKSGAVEQFLAANVASWCQRAGNSTYLSIETEGYVQEPFTAPQLTALQGLYSWMVAEWGLPRQLAEHPGERGLGWHGMGAPAWGHAACPGELRRAARAQIIGTTPAPAPAPSPVPVPAPSPAPAPVTGPYQGAPWPSIVPRSQYFGLITGPAASHGGYYPAERPYVRQIQQRLIWAGFVPGISDPNSSWADGKFEQPTADAVTRFQRVHMPGTRFYGQVWTDDWAALFNLTK